MLRERAAQLLAILVIEAAVGYPSLLQQTVRHPVVWIGSLIATIERSWNVGGTRRRRLAGCALLIVLLLVTGVVGWICDRMDRTRPPAMLALVCAGTAMLAQRSLHEHVAAVLHPLQAGDLAAARHAVAKIVGRDTASLNDAEIATAAIESLSESFCDGIVAPACWFLVAGFAGLFACKAINTADSMVGHRNDRYREFGCAVARADDLVNWVPARLAGALICMAGASGLRTMLRDSHRHASPNGGWPEAAMAGVLGCRLGGAVSYDGETALRARLGAGPPPDAARLRAALGVYRRACLALWLLAAGVAWLS